jgi:hypothetical protein
MLNWDQIVAAVPVAATSLTTALLAVAYPGQPIAPSQKALVPQVQADTTSRTPLGMAVNGALQVRASHRATDAVVWEEVLASGDGKVVCLVYRVRSGDADVRRRVAFVSGSSGFEMVPWESSCQRGVVAIDEASKWIPQP